MLGPAVTLKQCLQYRKPLELSLGLPFCLVHSKLRFDTRQFLHKLK